MAPASAPSPDGARTVLYIEDNLSNLELVQRILARQPDLRLLTATRGQEGLHLAQQHHPRVILLDVHLPDLSGDEVLRRLKSEGPLASIPVVVISADATPVQRARLLSLGARDYLTKPLDVRAFMAVLRQALEEGE
ncbi:MAG: response regulator [Armatimonadota bacterium]|nr:response regulator [Armatimonadota bacterium]MDR7427079.1 response regulator [Armatimonadota bacterium]MDR7464087.1 response regulator [Armatimonadota bacterium]MDR7471030.1 response regulator [Armatimonadota bacterium]MDR7473641.1 response regulator [Armatimonadota bacterium]